MHQVCKPRFTRLWPALVALITVLSLTASTGLAQAASFPDGIQYVWVIAMENANWASLSGNASAPYINGLLARPDASYAEQYFNPRGLHPSEPNYVWLEAGAARQLPNGGRTVNFMTDEDPSPTNSTSTPDHLATYLNRAGLSWKAYQEGISGTECPLSSNDDTDYAAKHNPMIFFQDVTDGNNPSSEYCILHERPFEELATDLQSGTVPRYSFITPNLCNDMHDPCRPRYDRVKQGDDWLAVNLPLILSSPAYVGGGAVFITWDEAAIGDGPIGLIVLSPSAKGNGYHNAVRYDHSSLLRTLQMIFGVTNPWLGAAATAEDLGDLFKVSPTAPFPPGNP